MKFVCKVCKSHCYLPDNKDLIPIECPYVPSYKNAKWERIPSTDGLSVLPQWCKEGAWVYSIMWKELCKITKITPHPVWPWIEVLYASSGTGGYTADHFKPVTWRAWTLEEMTEMMPLVVCDKSRTEEQFRYAISRANLTYVFLGCYDHGTTYQTLLNNYSRVNGLPCGVPQVDGKDVEIK